MQLFIYGSESDIFPIDRREDCHNLDMLEPMDVNPQVAKGSGGEQSGKLDS